MDMDMLEAGQCLCVTGRVSKDGSEDGHGNSQRRALA
jgi:hypothetical protein